jgi:anti-sigma factor (TIGR02949 family)
MLPPDCEAALLQLDAYRHGELAPEDLQSLREHLDACRRCFSYKLHEEAFLDRLVVAARNGSCPEELRATIYQMVAKESRDN